MTINMTAVFLELMTSGKQLLRFGRNVLLPMLGKKRENEVALHRGGLS